ncbi:DNA cytosine methyltransferase [Hellea sp.]|nr:DNA cytosine methyltransferase [Hellea sp.]MDA8996843.1 DNA cytosine methyltransferase [Hellea sp.]
MAINKINSVDLFSGAGGMAEGFEKAGIQTLVANDVDQMAQKTFCYNHPKVPFIVRDIANVTAKELLDAGGISRGNVDVVAGGPPCQGFSIAGRRMENDPRNSLFLEFVRIVKELQPRIVLFENVRGLTSMQGGSVLDAILEHFTELGYICEWKILDASQYGVPQARPRFVLICAAPGTEFSFPEIEFGETSSQANLFAKQLKPRISVWDALSDLPYIEQGQGAEEMHHSGNHNNTYQLDRSGNRNPGIIYNHRATRHSELIQERYRLIPEGKNNVSLPPHLRTKKTNVYKLDRARPARTVTCNHRTDLLHPTIPRGTTVREAARLQSFDDDYRFFGNLTRKAAWVTQDDQVGNAVPPLLAKALAKSIIASLQKNSSSLRHAS